MEEKSEDNTGGSAKLIGGAIVLAGIIIAGAIISSNNLGSDSQAASPQGAVLSIRDVSSSDHIEGPLDAPVVIIEYSDLECPYCKQFHITLTQIRENFGDNVAWVIRHFPLESIHPNAPLLAAASECAAELGGNKAFWNFVNTVFEKAPGNLLDIKLLPDIANEVGLDSNAFMKCTESGKYDEKVNND